MMGAKLTAVELTDSERNLLIELLEAEQHDLPHEIHHTRTAALKAELRERAERVEALLAKLRR